MGFGRSPVSEVPRPLVPNCFSAVRRIKMMASIVLHEAQCGEPPSYGQSYHPAAVLWPFAQNQVIMQLIYCSWLIFMAVSIVSYKCCVSCMPSSTFGKICFIFLMVFQYPAAQTCPKYAVLELTIGKKMFQATIS